MSPMKDYELLAFVNESPSSALPGKESVDLITSIVKQQGGETVKVDSLGRRPMGYLVKKLREGTLVVSHCRFAPVDISKFVRSLRLNNTVLTHMITVRKESVARQRLTVPPPQETRPVRKPTRGRVKA